MGLYLLDTNVCIDILRGREGAGALPALDKCRLSAIVEAELWVGVARSSDPVHARLRVQAFLDAFTVLPFGSEASEAYGEIRSHLLAAGTPFGGMDGLIAAHARSLGATLLTATSGNFRGCLE